MPMPGKKRLASRLPTATRPTPGKRQQRARLHVLGAHAVQQRVLVRMQAAAQRLAVGQASRNGARRASSRGDHLQPVDVVQARDRLEQHDAHQVAVEILGQRSRPSPAACRRRCPGASAPASAGACAPRGARSPARWRTAPAGGATARGSCRAALPAGSWPATRPGLPRAAPPGVSARSGNCCRNFGCRRSQAATSCAPSFSCRVHRSSSHRHSPSNTNAAGPAIVIDAASSRPVRSAARRRAARRRPSRSMRPRRISTAAAAQAPLPQASVSPTPRSYTRRRMRSRAIDLRRSRR